MTYLTIPQVLVEWKPEWSWLENSVKKCKKNTKGSDSHHVSGWHRFLESNFDHQFDLVLTKVDSFILMMVDVGSANDYGKVTTMEREKWWDGLAMMKLIIQHIEHSLFHEQIDAIDICCFQISWIPSAVPWIKHHVLFESRCPYRFLSSWAMSNVIL